MCYIHMLILFTLLSLKGDQQMIGLIIIAIIMLVIAGMILCKVSAVEVISREFWEGTSLEFTKNLRRFQNLEHV